MSKKSSKQPASSLEHQKQQQQQQQQHKQVSGESNSNSKSNLKNQSSHNLPCEQHFGAKLQEQQTASKRKQTVVAAKIQTSLTTPPSTTTTLVKNHRSKGLNQKRSKMQPQQSQPELLEHSNQDPHHHHNQETSKLDTKPTTTNKEQQKEQLQQQQQQQQQKQTQKQGDNICAACLKPIRERYLLVALDKQWHEDCLKCACCDCRLGEVGSSLFTHADKILCRRDFLRIFGQAGNCAACKKSIPPYELVMRANENAYHMECFACQQCQYRFCVGDRFHLNDAHRIVCILCHAELQQQNGQQSQSHSTSYHTPVDVQLVGAAISEQSGFHFGAASETHCSLRQAGAQEQQQQQSQRQIEKEDPMQHSSSSQPQSQQPVQIKQTQQPAATCAM